MSHWNDCGLCVDADTDLRGANCNLGSDCDDASPYSWNSCATCIDADADTWYQLCNAYSFLGGDTLKTVGTGTGTWTPPLRTTSHDARVQSIYLASELGGRATITSLVLNVVVIPGQSLTNFTIRLKHTPLAAYSSYVWDGPASGWTTVYQANETISATGWRTFTFTTPFVYNGTDNLMVDMSFNNSSATTNGAAYVTTGAAVRSIYAFVNSTNGDPLDWTGSTPAPNANGNFSNLRFGLDRTLNGPDCNDANTNTWNTCAACLDTDADTWYAGCNRYLTINGPDCSDTNTNVGDTCATCIDADGDSWYAGCNRYVTINGPDCSDANPYAWAACSTCVDTDSDTWYGQCDRYSASAGLSFIGSEYASSTDLPLSTNYNTCRTEMIYLASEIARSGMIISLALQLTDVPGQAMNNFTIRLKHTTLTNHATASWQGPASGWTTVYQTNEPIGATGWRTFTFTTPFNYNGTDNLMVDISFNNTSTSGWGKAKYVSAASRSIYYRTNSTSYGDPLNWTGTSNPTPTVWSYIPNLRLNFTAPSINGPDCDDTIATGPSCHDTCSPFYLDQDSDAYGDPSSSVTTCVAPAGYVADNTDCGPTDTNNWNMCATCRDADGDTWFAACDRYATINGPDCLDDAASGSSCHNTCLTLYLDQDADSFGDPASFAVRCSIGYGYVADWNDCAPAVSTIYPGAPEACDGLDNQCPGETGYGTIDEGCVPPDADGDGLTDGEETILGTNPNKWDTDGDGLSDKFEADNATGHDPDKLLDPLNSADGNTADFDGDGIGNAHEYWNGTSPWAVNPAGYAACGYWGEADSDGFITGNDRDMLLSASIGNPTDYANVFPPTGETQDLDGDGWYTGNDVDLLNSMMVGADTPFVQSRPAALEAIDTCAATLAVGDTCHVSVAVLNSMTPTAGRQAGVAVVFTVDPSSTGSATIFGGEGAGDLGAGRYDLSTSALSSPAGVSRAVVRADAPGTITISARVPQCGTEVGVGRSSAEIVLPEFATVTVP